MINQSIVVRCFQTNHLTEFGAFLCVQSISLVFGQGLGVFIVFSCTFNHLQRHGGVGRVVLVEVEYPFQTGSKVLCITVCHLVAIDIDPFYTLTNFKGPGQTVVLGSPFFCDTRNQFTFFVNLQQTIDQVGQVFAVLASLGVQDVEGFQLTADSHRKSQVGDAFFGIFLCRSRSAFRSGISALFAATAAT